MVPIREVRYHFLGIFKPLGEFLARAEKNVYNIENAWKRSVGVEKI